MLVRQEADSAVDLVACLDLEVEVLVVTFSCLYWRYIMKVTHNCLFQNGKKEECYTDFRLHFQC